MPELNVNITVNGLMIFIGQHNATAGVLPSSGSIKKGWTYEIQLDGPAYTPVTIDGIELYHGSLVTSRMTNPGNDFTTGWLRLRP